MLKVIAFLITLSLPVVLQSQNVFREIGETGPNVSLQHTYGIGNPINGATFSQTVNGKLDFGAFVGFGDNLVLFGPTVSYLLLKQGQNDAPFDMAFSSQYLLSKVGSRDEGSLNLSGAFYRSLSGKNDAKNDFYLGIGGGMLDVADSPEGYLAGSLNLKLSRTWFGFTYVIAKKKATEISLSVGHLLKSKPRTVSKTEG